MSDNTFHYTDKDGWNAIRSQLEWLFKTSQPLAKERPNGVYFTDIEPTEENLRTLHKRIRVPKKKQDFVFWFTGRDGLTQLFEGRGRDRRIFFSDSDYTVEKSRQQHEGIEATPKQIVAAMMKQLKKGQDVIVTEAGNKEDQT